MYLINSRRLFSALLELKYSSNETQKKKKNTKIILFSFLLCKKPIRFDEFFQSVKQENNSSYEQLETLANIIRIRRQWFSLSCWWQFDVRERETNRRRSNKLCFWLRMKTCSSLHFVVDCEHVWWSQRERDKTRRRHSSICGFWILMCEQVETHSIAFRCELLYFEFKIQSTKNVTNYFTTS